MGTEHDDHPDPRYCAMYTGVVVDNADPEQLGRARLRIPGIVETSTAWALPMGAPGGGAPQRGFWDPPDVGAEVSVWFKAGDVDHPYFLPGNWGRGEQPTAVTSANSPAGATQIKTYETRRWSLTFDDRPGHALLQLKDKQTGDVIEIDGVGKGINIEGSAMVHIKAVGPVVIEGLAITLNGRPVVPGGGPI